MAAGDLEKESNASPRKELSHESTNSSGPTVRLDKVLHAVTFIPKTGHKIRSSKKKKKNTVEQFHWFVISLPFSKPHLYEDPFKKMNQSLDSHQKTSQVQTDRETMCLLSYCWWARMKQAGTGNGRTRGSPRSGLVFSVVTLSTRAFEKYPQPRVSALHVTLTPSPCYQNRKKGMKDR